MRRRVTSTTGRPGTRVRILLLAALLLGCFLFSSGFTAGQKVYDNAGLLTDAQIADLQAECLRVANAKGIDVVLLTVADAGGKSAMEVADDFFDQNAFGYDAPHGTGILMLIDMDNRTAWISTSGAAVTYFTDTRIELVLDSVFKYLPDGDYHGSFKAFLSDVEYYMGRPVQGGEGPRAPWWTGLVIQLVVAVLAGAFTVIALVARAGGVMTVGNRDYMTGVRMNAASDQFLRKVVTVRVIPRNTGGGGGSSTHMSGGGFSHGGGGRGF